ncbi:4107_t:CDS:2 [Racocetra persica]|uniref:4107_t:CDS:1 n=1 Tax=Racocetra persica TaxID=160502 RepID=A0ACA9PJH1_9GLOM|nr:4107_t:CDS:2 [Racocetra persica]
MSQKGAYLLDFFYKKSKDAKGYPFNPDKLTDPNIHFCQIGKKVVKRFIKGGLMSKDKWVEEETEVIGGDKGNAGHLAIGTGIAKGEVEMAYCLRGNPTQRATEEEIKEGKHDPEMKSLYKSHGSYPLKKEVKEKLIPQKETIVVFDEAHFNDAGYQSLQFEMIKAGYNCLRMSATFPGAEFSTTSSYPMKRIHCDGPIDPNMPGGLMIYQNAEQVEKLENLRGVPVELSDEQIRTLGNNVSYMVYTPEFDENCEDISHGRPKGSADNVDDSKAMGYTPRIDTVICLGAIETTNLGKYFTYSDPTLGFIDISNLVQEMGRVSRTSYGLAITLTKECGEVDLSDNVSAAMVRTTFNGDIKQINDKEYKQIYDIDILRGALAYPDPKTFGKAPEEILMGLKITKDQQSKKEKLTQLV